IASLFVVSIFGSCSNRYFRYSNGIRLFSFAVSTMLYIIALDFAPFGVLLNKKFFLPMTKGLMERSLRLLSISNLPSSKNTISLCHWFRQYLIALPSALFGRTFGVCDFIHAEIVYIYGIMYIYLFS